MQLFQLQCYGDHSSDTSHFFTHSTNYTQEQFKTLCDALICEVAEGYVEHSDKVVTYDMLVDAAALKLDVDHGFVRVEFVVAEYPGDGRIIREHQETHWLNDGSVLSTDLHNKLIEHNKRVIKS